MPSSQLRDSREGPLSEVKNVQVFSAKPSRSTSDMMAPTPSSTAASMAAVSGGPGEGPESDRDTRAAHAWDSVAFGNVQEERFPCSRRAANVFDGLRGQHLGEVLTVSPHLTVIFPRVVGRS